ncbi:hypothetical protein PV327_002940 [Microctonus hyperodae]|uniref:Uncharacterized protein n=1 Tax=Microctonus hyperodae TaxID=165561 RepID=A0AA39G3B4_MICHY|nr:hypothetical protein PV327_002940 [Microctonus hyperodae]
MPNAKLTLESPATAARSSPSREDGKRVHITVVEHPTTQASQQKHEWRHNQQQQAVSPRVHERRQQRNNMAQKAPHISIDDDEPSLHHSTMLAPSATNTNQPGSASVNSHPDVAAASIRRAALPSFLKEEPDIWFIIAEAEFLATNTSSDNVIR